MNQNRIIYRNIGIPLARLGREMLAGALKFMLLSYRASDGEDIYDLCWSPDDQFILVGLTDNTAQLWDLTISKAFKFDLWGTC